MKIIEDFGRKIYLSKNFNQSQKLLKELEEDIKNEVIKIIKLSESAKDAINKIKEM